MALFQKIHTALRRIKSRNSLLAKGRLRDYLAYRKTTGVKARVYVNAMGEKFAVTRKEDPDNFDRKKGYVLFNLLITPLVSLGEIHQVTGGITVNYVSNQISIYSIETHPERQLKRSRGFFQVILDECKQIGQKEFKQGPYTITLIPRNKKLKQYYLSQGFKPNPEDPEHLDLYVPSKQRPN